MLATRETELRGRKAAKTAEVGFAAPTRLSSPFTEATRAMKAADVGFVVATRPCGGYAVHLPSKNTTQMKVLSGFWCRFRAIPVGSGEVPIRVVRRCRGHSSVASGMGRDGSGGIIAIALAD